MRRKGSRWGRISSIPSRPKGACTRASLRIRAVAQVNRAGAEAVFSQKLEVEPNAGRKASLSTADEHRYYEEVELVDETGVDRLRRQLCAANRKVTARSRLHLPDRVPVELPLKPGPDRCDGLKRSREDDLLRALPDRREVLHHRRLLGKVGWALPVGHRLVYTAPVQVRADRSFEF